MTGPQSAPSVAAFGRSDMLIRRFSIKHFTSPKDGAGFFNGPIEGEDAFPDPRPAWCAGELPPSKVPFDRHRAFYRAFELGVPEFACGPVRFCRS